MANPLIGWFNVSDVTATYSPTFAGPAWSAAHPLTNVQDRRTHHAARSVNAAFKNTRFRQDLGTSRTVRVAAAPTHNLSSAALARLRAYDETPYFLWHAGDDITAMGGTFTRASSALYVDRTGQYQSASSNVARDNCFEHNTVSDKFEWAGYLAEEASTNRCIYSSKLNSWMKEMTPTVTNDAVMCGVVGLAKVEDNDATPGTGRERVYLAVTLGGADGYKSLSCLLKYGNTTHSHIGLYDTVAATWRMFAVVAWNGADAAPTILLPGGFGNSLGLQERRDSTGAKVWRLTLNGNNCIVANTHRVYFAPAVDAAGFAHEPVGHAYCGGVQVEDTRMPGEVLPESNGSGFARVRDSMRAPHALGTGTFGTADDDFTLYVELVRPWWMGTTTSTYHTENPKPAGVGFPAGAGTGELLLAVNGDTALKPYYAVIDTLVTDGVTLGTTPPAPFVQQVCAQFEGLAAGGVSRIDVGAGFAADGSVATAITAFGNEFVGIGQRAANSGSLQGYVRTVRLERSLKTLSEMAPIYDSGPMRVFGGVYPSGVLPVGHASEMSLDMSAEDADGYPVGLTFLPGGVSARYWYWEFNDPSNAAGYVEVGRLWVSDAWQPAVAPSPGAELMWATNSARDEAGSDVANVEDRVRRRVCTITLPANAPAVALANAWEIGRRGIHAQCFIVLDPSDSAHLHRRSFLASLRDGPDLEHNSGNYYRVPLSFVEEL